jgi:hypothetical protein
MFHVKHAKRDRPTRKIRKDASTRTSALGPLTIIDLDELWMIDLAAKSVMPQKAWHEYTAPEVSKRHRHRERSRNH